LIIRDASYRSQSPQGCYFFLDKKVTKKSRHQYSFFAAPAFALQIRQHHGLHIVAPTSYPQSMLQQQNAMPFPAHNPMCCLISSRSLTAVGVEEIMLLQK
jgi:hypothetical protein